MYLCVQLRPPAHMLLFTTVVLVQSALRLLESFMNPVKTGLQRLNIMLQLLPFCIIAAGIELIDALVAIISQPSLLTVDVSDICCDFIASRYSEVILDVSLQACSVLLLLREFLLVEMDFFTRHVVYCLALRC